jgi:Uncharacterised nucleotidyltransferase
MGSGPRVARFGVTLVAQLGARYLIFRAMNPATSDRLYSGSWRRRAQTQGRSVGHRAERDLILLSAGTAARRDASRERAERLIDDVQWSCLTQTLRSRTLLPVLGPRILELADGRAPEDFSNEVQHSIAAGRRQSTFLELAGHHVSTELARAGIRSTPLKGPQLGERIYGDPGRRLSTDIDLLVSAQQLHRSVETLERLGYAAPVDRVDQEGGLPLLHFALAHTNGELPPVELHWRIHWYERRFGHERLLPPDGMVGADWLPEPADELAALLLFYARDGFVDLRLATDLGAWWDVFGSSLGINRLDEVLRCYPRLGPVLPVAARVAEKVVGLPSEEVIRHMPTMGPRAHLAVRMADPNPNKSSAQLYADMGFVDGLLTPWRELGAFMRRQVLLPQVVLDDYAQRSDKWGARSPLDYSSRVLARYGLAMIRAVRRADRSV